MNIVDIRGDQKLVEGIRFSDGAFLDTTGGGQAFTITDNDAEELIDIPYRDIDNLVKALRRVQSIRQIADRR